MYSMTMDLLNTDLRSLLTADSRLDNKGDLSKLSNARMLQQFQVVTSHTLGCSSMQGIMQSFVGSNAWSHPSLMHLVLAVSFFVLAMYDRHADSHRCRALT